MTKSALWNISFICWQLSMTSQFTGTIYKWSFWDIHGWWWENRWCWSAFKCHFEITRAIPVISPVTKKMSLIFPPITVINLAPESCRSTPHYPSPIYVCDSALDEDPGSSWVASGCSTSDWLEIDLPVGGPYRVGRVQLQNRLNVGQSKLSLSWFSDQAGLTNTHTFQLNWS